MKNNNLTKDIISTILKKAKTRLSQQIKWRRHLHQYPELSFQEHKTTSFLKEKAKSLKLQILPLKLKTGLLAEITGKYPGATVAVRSDIDALPVIEQNNLPYKSKIKDCMHACGHDMHMATVLGTASILMELRDKIHGRVRFIFQPAEEMPPGGARPMIAEGVLKNVSMIFGLHVDPNIPTGKIGLRDGVTMASVTDFDLIIHGKGGHAARPHTTVDAIVTAAEVIDSIQKIISREIDPIQPAAITFGKMEGGRARNVICDRVILTGTARALSPKAAKDLPRLIRKTAAGVCRARGAKVEMNIIANYPVLINHREANRIFTRNFDNLFGKGKLVETSQVLGGEDFACYLEKTKGAMFRLGMKNKKIKSDKPWHSPLFKADEQAIFYGTSLLVASVLDYLQGSGG